MSTSFLLAAMIVAAPWKTIANEGGVKVETRDAGGGHTIVRGTTELEVPAQAVVAVLEDLDGFRTWIPSLETWKVVDKKKATAIVYARHDLPWPMDDRDYRVRYTWRSLSDGRFQLSARSTTDAGPGPVDGVIRLKDVRSLWKVEPLGSDRARVTYQYHGDLGGDLPEAVVKSAWAKEPVTLFTALDRAIAAKKSKSDP